MKTCLFCKAQLSAVDRSIEHVIPQWLQIEWNLKKKQLEPTHLDKNFKIISQRKHDFSSFVSGDICANCNNGWMSKLENTAKNLILNLAAGRTHVGRLSHDEALLIARWTAKTAFVMHASSNWRRVIPEDHYRILDTNSYNLPDGVFVIGHSFNGSKIFSWSQTTTWTIQGIIKECQIDNLHAVGYKISFRIGGLFLMILHNPFPQARVLLWKYKHFPLYPRWSYPVAWLLSEKTWPAKATKRFMVFSMEAGIAFPETTN